MEGDRGGREWGRGGGGETEDGEWEGGDREGVRDRRGGNSEGSWRDGEGEKTERVGRDT